MKLGELTWEEARDFKAQMVLLPVGSFEQHGYHLPLNNDTFVAEKLACIIASKLNEQGYKTLVAPALPIGLSAHHMGFFGSLTVGPETFQSLIRDVCSGLGQHGFTKIVIVNGHGGNSAAIRSAIESLAGLDRVCVLEYWRHLSPDCVKEIDSKYFCHACEGETSVSLALGQRANIVKAVEEYPLVDSQNYNLLNKGLKVGFEMPPLHTISCSGVIGNAKLADKGKGERILAKVLPELVSMLSKEFLVDKVG